MSGDNEQLTSDLTKANEILHRKIDEIKQIKEKYKRNAEIIKRQEEILNQKDQDLKVRAKLQNFHALFLPTEIFSTQAVLKQPKFTTPLNDFDRKIFFRRLD